MANTKIFGTSDFLTQDLWVDDVGSSTNEHFSGLRSNVGSPIGNTQRLTYSEFTFDVGDLHYRYVGEWEVSGRNGVLTGTVSASGEYDRIVVEQGGSVVAVATLSDALAVDFGTRSGLTLLEATNLPGVALDVLFGPDEPVAYKNLHLDATPGLPDVTGVSNSIAGGATDDLLIGDGKRNALSGRDGDDFLRAGDGDDVLRGGDGNDRLVGGDGNDTMLGEFGTDRLFGSGGNDRMDGGRENDLLSGGSGDDTLLGGVGNDRLNGAGGLDVLTGGDGRDVFIFNVRPADAGVDTITDFDVRDDTIFLDLHVFDELHGTGRLTADEIYRGPAAHDASDRIIYDKDTGHVLYDADGTGDRAAVHFATLDAGLSITTGDFLII